jgi:MFS family permease
VAVVTVFARYGEVLRGRGTAVPLVASIVGRLSLGMTTLALLLLVRDTSGSYASAGMVCASYAFAFGLLGPSRARAADRSGPVRALLATAVVHPVALAVLVALAVADAPTWALLPPAVLGGASVPPHGPVMRALWGSLLDGPLRATAYSLESVVVELCFVIGPLLTALLAALVHPGAAVLAAAALALAGALWMVTAPAVRDVVPHETPHASRVGPLVSPAVRALLLTVVGIGIGFGAIEVAMPAYAESEGARPAAAGLLLAVWAAGSICGGLVYGGLHLSTPHRRQLPFLVAALAVGSALPLVATGPVAMSVALFAYGLTIAPFGACNSVLLGEAAPPGTTTEAFAWSSSMIFGGAALGSAVAGVLVDRSGPVAALLVTAAAGVLALLAALAGVARLRGAETVRS